MQDAYGEYQYYVFGGITQRFRWIPPGRFLMGSPEGEEGRYDDEGPQHEVTISQGFWLMDTPVTQALWVAVMGNNPSRFKGDPRRPVEQVSWDDAMRFIKRLNGMIPDLNLVLPTEAQWEYAAAAGPLSLDQVNYRGGPGEFRGKTVPVKTFRPNPWGLYQMHGNVWEWCADGLREYGSEAVVDPVGPPAAWSQTAARGGSWGCDLRGVRTAARGKLYRNDRLHGIGFRCAI